MDNTRPIFIFLNANEFKEKVTKKSQILISFFFLWISYKLLLLILRLLSFTASVHLLY